MDFRGFTACAIIALCLIKQSDADPITAWAETGGNSATITGASGSMTVATVTDNIAAGGTLFTVTATPASATYAFDANGNPGGLAAIAAATGVVTIIAALDITTGKPTNFGVSAGAVTTAVAMSASTKAGYAITVTATDANGKTSVANIWIVVGICSGAMKITVTAALVLMSFVSAYLI
ncbi:hypothetical protein MAR_035796 [Mya arenaria]|uniref:Uncharacterized protein n=1 Tax=Mya arenaria TaxID=6604 RepID=A0ABY7END8_MYAAR|nr:hypothetical protein MAR_035796 [Mya arenaria]